MKNIAEVYPYLEKKIIDMKALDVDIKTKRVKVAISKVSQEDRDKDTFYPSAYDKTIKENGPQGTNEIWHLLDHTQKSFSALSKFSEMNREGDYLTGVSQYKNSFAWREVAWPLYEAGDITQHSVGFQVLDATERDSKGARIIKQVRLWEGSAVLWGAMPDTPTMAVVKSLMNMDDDRDITAAEKIDEIIKKIKKERKGYDEEDMSLLIIELKHLQTLFGAGQISAIFNSSEPASNATPTTTKATEPDTKATLPDVDSLIKIDSVVPCPACGKHTHNTQQEKGFIKCHRCEAMFNYGSLLYVKL